MVTSGVEALGQNLLSTIANILRPGARAHLAGVDRLDDAEHARSDAGRPRSRSIIVTMSVALMAETYFVIRYLGNALARAEPLQTE